MAAPVPPPARERALDVPRLTPWSHPALRGATWFLLGQLAAALLGALEECALAPFGDLAEAAGHAMFAYTLGMLIILFHNPETPLGEAVKEALGLAAVTAAARNALYAALGWNSGYRVGLATAFGAAGVALFLHAPKPRAPA